jgi:curli biogenesis system outer membrane secretion channel CsgG
MHAMNVVSPRFRIRAAVAICAALAAFASHAADVSLAGPKRAIVVDKFESTGQFNAAYGDWDVGGGLAAMLTTALSQSGQFVVLERANMQRIVFEQELKSNNVANPETGPKLGQVSGAQFIVIGAVTEFGLQDKGGSVNIGLGGGTKNPLNTLFGAKRAEGAVAMDLRIVDTSTTQVVQTVKVKETISQTSLNASADYRQMTMGGDQFNNTPLGEAARHAIEKAVQEIISTAARQPWHALLVDINGADAVINAGQGAGVKIGDRFNVERITQRLTDPATGEVLTVRRAILGTLVVTGVEDRVSFATYAPSDPNVPARGDMVVMPK